MAVDYDQPVKDYLTIRDWGKPGDLAVARAIKGRACCRQFLDRHLRVDRQPKELTDYANCQRELNKDQVKARLHPLRLRQCT